MNSITQIHTKKLYKQAVGGMLLVLLSLSGQISAQSLYEREYPVMEYGSRATTDAFSRLMAKVDSGEVVLEVNAERGYLDALLEALEINPASQLLVFSKTSLKQRFINAENPRSLFFNDEVYVGFVPGSRTLEIAAMDPFLGPVFFDFNQRPEISPRSEQETGRCLRCHDSYSMTGGGVPRFMMSSVMAGPDGNIVSHELSEMTDTSTPLNRRWGGWYVTGHSGAQTHMGNLVISDTAVLRNRELTGELNRNTLDGLVDTSEYPNDSSDIVALLVLEHQVEVQNRITRVNYDGRMLLAEHDNISEEQLQTLVQPLLDALFMVNEAPLADAIVGLSGYAEYFTGLGPFDAEGRSLRQLDLQTRTFRYPLSYLIYSPAIDALPEQIKSYLFARIAKVLTAETVAGNAEYPHLTAGQRRAIRQILEGTKPEVLQARF